MNENLMQNLNAEQLEAVLHRDGPLLIVAGAGTGKTTVITQKIAYMIEQGWAKSDEILALTFTEKAAGEMEERVDRLLPIGYLDLWISTFHGFAEKILKAHGLAIGLPGEFKLLNEFEQWILIQKNLDRFDLNYYKPLGNPGKFITAMVKHFSRLKDEDIAPDLYLKYAEELKQNLDAMLSGSKKKSGRGKSQITNPKTQTDKEGGDKEIAEQEVERVNEIANAYHVYQQLLLENSALDFGDLINYTLKLFRERPAILKKYREQFKYILVDEFQDTNWAQYELVKMLSGDAPDRRTGRNNLVVVGDDDQSIYRFRGASMSNILQFKKDFPKTKQVVLVQNYRSKQNILNLAYEFIKLNNPNRLEWQLKQQETRNPPDSLRDSKRTGKKQETSAGKNTLNKKLLAQNEGEGEIEVLEADDLAGEVRTVVEKIIELEKNDKEASWSDFAILVRANDHAKEFCSALETVGLPYQFLASRGLYAKPVIMDAIAYFNLLDDYHESRALHRILNIPIFKFTQLELVNLNNIASRKAQSLFEVLRGADNFEMPPEVKKKIREVLTLLSRHAVMVRDKTVGQIFLAFLNDSGYLKYLTEQAPLDSAENGRVGTGTQPKNLTGQAEARSRENIGYLNQFMKRIQTFEAGSDDKSVKAFLRELKLEINSGEEGSLPFDPESGPEAIKVMTVHGAKGLEFKYVIVANLVDRRFPTDERREQIEIPDALVKEIISLGDAHLEEERRLFYVAMTRAREGLYFSWAPDYGGARKKKPSRFLLECGLVEREERGGKGVGGEKGGRGEEGGRGKRGAAQSNLAPFAVASPSRSNGAFKQPEFQMPAYLSYTQLAAFGNCPYQYRFAHILRVPVRGKGVFSFGKTMHATLQKVFELINERRGLGQASLFGGKSEAVNDPKIELEEIYKLYEQSWQDDWYESKSQKEDYRKKGKEILKIFYEKYRAAWPEVLCTEKDFKLKLPHGGEFYTVRGRIDRIDINADKLKLVDYKTGSPKEKLTFEEKEQLLIYQLAAADLFRQEVGALSFYYLDDNSEVEFLGTTGELNRIKEKIIATVGGIKAGEFPPKPSKLCRWCDFFEICEYRQS